MSKQKLYELKSQRADAIELARKALAEGNNEEYGKQKEIVKGFNTQIEAFEELEAEESKYAKPTAPAVEKKTEATGYEKAVKALGDAVRSNFAIKAVTQRSMMNTEHGIDGGYAVPEDIVALVFSLRDAEESLPSEVTVNTVTAKTGRRTMKKRSQHAGFATVAEAAKYPKLANPEFQIVEYAIEKRGGYLPATAEVYEYSDGDIARVVEEWMSAEARATANREILEQIATKDQVNLTDMDGILKAWVGLGAAFRSTSKLITNDDGLAYLATLKGEDGSYLMSPNPVEPRQMQLAVGPYVLPVKVFDKLTMPSTCTKAPMILGDLKAGKLEESAKYNEHYSNYRAKYKIPE
jgi:HK97 family phage major capsid protein